MAAFIESLGLWLADFHLLAGALLALVLVAIALLRQPAQRMAATKATLAALGALAVLCAMPGWSLVHLLAADAAPPAQAVASTALPSAPPAPMTFEFAPAKNAAPFPVPQNATSAPIATPAPAQPASESWPAALVTLHAAGSALVVAWLVAGAMLARRMHRASKPAPPRIKRALRSLVGAAQPPRLLVNSEISTPLALGLGRPAILLPAGLVETPRASQSVVDGNSPSEAAARDLAAILAHELAHIVAGDLRTLAASRLLLVLLWPQPLYWALRRALRLDQETLADAAAADVAGRIDYAEQLLGWARTAPARAPRFAGAVGLWEGPSQLKRRIATLLDEQLTVLRHCSRRWRVGTACTALAAAALLSLVTLQRQEAAAQIATDGGAGEAGDPAAGTSSLVQADAAPAAGSETATAPASGAEGVALPPKPEKFVRIVVGPGSLTFEGDETTWDALPALLGKIENRGKTALEIAVASDDMSLRQVNDAQSQATILARQFGFLYSSYIGVHPLGSTGTAAAAVDGGETAHSVPRVGTWTAVRVADGNVAFPVDLNAASQSPPTTPNAITIRCLDAAGVPLADVDVTLYRVNFWSGAANQDRDARTNAAGEVTFADLLAADRIDQYKQLPAGGDVDDQRYREGYIIAARREGLATTSVIAQDFILAQRGFSAELKIGPAQTFSGRVVDSNGRPVAGAVVKAGNLASRFTIEGLNAVRTDADGRYKFTDRPKHMAAEANKRLNNLSYYSTAASDEVAAQAPRSVPGEDLEASKLIVIHPDYAVTSVDGGDIPGTLDVTMLPAAAITGRVVMDKTGAPVADMAVKAYKRPELELGPDGAIRPKSTAEGRLLGMSAGHSAETRTDSAGRYRMSNLPAGVYDVWASPPRVKERSDVQLFNLGVAGLAVAAGPRPIVAPELVVGDGAIVEGQLVDATTSQPIQLPEGSRVMLSRMPVGGPRAQENYPTKLPVTANGKFETRVGPGKFRVTAFVFDAPDPNGKLVFQSPDNSHAVGEVFEANHGGRVSAAVKVMPFALLEQQRAARMRAYNLIPQIQDDSKAAEAVAAFTDALQQLPNDYDLLAGRARANESLRDFAAAVVDYEQMLKSDPTSTYAAMGLANLLATCPNANIRDGARAVPLAEAVVAAAREEGSFEGMPRVLALLAAAQAEAGQFEAAVATQREVIKLAPDDQRDDMTARLRLYEDRQPFHRE